MNHTVRREYVDGPYGQLHNRVVAPTDISQASIVCLHMSPKSGRLFAELLPHLAERRLVLAPDYPGHGESDAPPAEPHVTIEDFARSVWSVIDAHDASPLHFVGHHTGAMVAVEAASQRPDRVLSIVSISAPVFTVEEQQQLAGEFTPIPIDAAGIRFQILWERVMQHRGPGMTLQMAATSFAENLRSGDHYEWGHRAAFAYSQTYNQRLAEIDHPVFIMNPNDDCCVPSRRADSMMKNGRRKDFQHWGHGFLNAYPQQAAAEMLGFIEDVERNA